MGETQTSAIKVSIAWVAVDTKGNTAEFRIVAPTAPTKNVVGAITGTVVVSTPLA